MSDATPVRLDVWLWAARFYKTRTLCKTAIEAGQVRVDGESVKPAKTVAVGMRLRIKQGTTLREVAVLGLSEQRRGAPEAQQLYAETAESLAKREAEQRARQAADQMQGAGRPSRKFRRAVAEFKKGLGYEG